ncbi:MAG: MGMT family protein, partial [Candidatus Korarchaeota archaeon]
SEKLSAMLEKILLSIPRGKVTTYGAVAKILKTSPRIIGKMLRKNKYPLIIPCHRVIRSDGHLGGYTPGGTRVKNAYLFLEGVSFLPNGRVAPTCIIGEKELSALREEHSAKNRD